MKPDETFIRRSDIEAAPMMAETVLYDPAAKQFCVLNATAACIWERLELAATVEELSSVVKDRFGTRDADPVEGDVRDTLQQLSDLDMISTIDN